MAYIIITTILISVSFLNLNIVSIIISEVPSFTALLRIVVSNDPWIVYLALLTVFLLLILLFLFFYLAKLKKRLDFFKSSTIADLNLPNSDILYTLIDNLPDYIYIKDIESRFLVANRKIALVAGKKSGRELTGLTDHDFYPRHLADSFRKDEIDIIVSKVPTNNKREKALDENGNNVIISTSKFPLHNSHGEFIGIVGIGRDITKQVEFEDELEKRNNDLKEITALLEERQEEILQQQEEMKTQNELIMEEKRHLQTLINSMPDRIYIKDRQSRFIVANTMLTSILKAKSPQELTGKTDFNFHKKELADGYYKDEQEIMITGNPIINKEEKGIDLNGNEIILSTTKVPVKDESGKIIGVVGIGRDISKQKEAERILIAQSASLQEINTLLEERKEEMHQQAEELKATSEHLRDLNKELEKLSLVASKTDNVIVIMDGDGNFEWVNDGFTKKYGMSLEEFKIKKGSNLRQTSFSENINEILNEIRDNKTSYTYQSETSTLSNKTNWFQTTISPVIDEDGNIVRLIAIDADVTKQKEAEVQINLQKQEIEQHHDELKKLNTTKDKFFSIIAHDLKNPFHAIIGLSDLLTRNYDSIEEDKKQEFIKLINESSTGAYELLDNLLNWARAQTNNIKFTPTRINVNELIQQNIHISSLAIKKKRINLETPEPGIELSAYADYNMVNTIIRNLLSNSIKFTQEGGSITINYERKNDQLQISIKDTGIGISEEDKQKLFKLSEFHTSHGTTGETGTGLGLIICKEFANKMGGDISVESLPDQGSTFTVSLPVKEN